MEIKFKKTPPQLLNSQLLKALAGQGVIFILTRAKLFDRNLENCLKLTEKWQRLKVFMEK